MKRILILLLFICTNVALSQNVAINGTGALPNASAMLDIASTSSGLLIPRMSTGQRTAIAVPATGLYVYDTTTGSFWYYNGTIWVEITTSSTGWLLAGNTLAGTEKLGSLNGQPVRFFSNNTERARIIASGEFVVNNTVPVAGDMFSSYAANTNVAIGAYGTGAGITMYSQNTGGGIAIEGVSTASTAFGVYGINTHASGTGVLAAGNGLGAGYATAGSGGAFTGSRIGVYAVSTNVSAGVSSSGVIGRDAGGSFTMLNGGAGVTGIAANSGVGMFAYHSGAGSAIYSQNASATAVTIQGYNTNASGTGALFVGNNAAGSTLVSGSGISAVGTIIGVVGISTSATNGILRAGGYFDTGTGQSFAYVGARTAANVIRKIEGNGTVNTVVKDLNENRVVLSAPESPENLFQDFGQGQLLNGRAHINLDPIFSKNIIVNEKHPLRVFVQLKGDCNGVYVTNENGFGFDIIELKGGSSNVKFTYFITANRADEIVDGVVSPYSEERFAPSIGPQAKIQAEAKTLSTEESKIATTSEAKRK